MAKFKAYVRDEYNQMDIDSLVYNGLLSEENLIEIAEAGANTLLEYCVEFLNKFHRITGTLAESLTVVAITNGAAVRPRSIVHHGRNSSTKGTHRSKTGQGKTYGRRRHGLTKGTSAMDVGYYLEYGSPRMPATHWMETCVEESEDAIYNAMQDELNFFLEKKNL